MQLFDSFQQRSSVPVAKSRLRSLLLADRMDCSPRTYETMKKELYCTISKYMEAVPDSFDIHVTSSHILISLTGEKN